MAYCFLCIFFGCTKTVFITFQRHLEIVLVIVCATCCISVHGGVVPCCSFFSIYCSCIVTLVRTFSLFARVVSVCVCVLKQQCVELPEPAHEGPMNACTQFLGSPCKQS